MGILLVSIPPLADLSYDLSYLVRPEAGTNGIVLIYANTETLSALGDDHGDIKRTDHSRLLDRLTQDGARLVFYDFHFATTNSSPDVDRLLGQAVARNGTVILVGAGQTIQTAEGVIEQNLPPIPDLRTNALGWGHAELYGDVVRTLSRSFSDKEYAPWVAAGLAAKGEKRKPADESDTRRWLNYYGAPGSSAFSSVLFQDVLKTNSTTAPPGYFRDNYVFIGQNFPTKKLGAGKDTFATPYSRLGAPNVPGVEIHATAFLNLVRGEWLRMVPWGCQALLAALWGVLITWLLFQLSLKPVALSLLTLVLAAIGLGLLSCLAQWQTAGHWWWGWFGPALLQSSAALAWVRLHPKPKRYLAFISYRRKHIHAVSAICREFRRLGYDVYQDLYETKPGPFPDRLHQGIANSDFFMVMLISGSLTPDPPAPSAPPGGPGGKPLDWMLLELQHARSLESPVPVVPLLFPGFSYATENPEPDWQLLIPDLKSAEAVEWGKETPEAFVERIIKLLRPHRRK